MAVAVPGVRDTLVLLDELIDFLIELAAYVDTYGEVLDEMAAKDDS